ncbi:MAG TPA: MlaD family protein [Verrucomicrobiae bacterium]|nr:MlaD family protein [Verrucomicrobiae bacterium]
MRIHRWAIGLFLTSGIGLFTAILFLIGNRHDVFGKHVEFYAEFSDIGGLPRGAQVRVSGIEAGEVKGIQIPSSPASKFRLKLQVRADARGMVRTDSLVSIRTEGIVGDEYVFIRKGTGTAGEAPDGATLPSKEPFDIGAALEKGSALLDKSSALLDNVHSSVTDLHGRLDVALESVTKTVNHVDGLVTVVQPDIRKLASNASQITDTINDIVSDLNAGKGPAGLLLRDETTRKMLQATLSNAQQATLNLSDASERADQVLADVQSRDLASKAQSILENVQAMSEQLNQTVKSALAPDNMGDDGATNIRETLSNLNRGTASLAEDTEALKHEFFFRGFFKKRGFYDLEQLSSADYLKACQRQNACGSRTWLDAANLFATGSNGAVLLDEAGRHAIDSAVAPVVDSLLGHLVIVEGYSGTGTPDQQFVTSRRRADLVREYLEAHFHLVHGEVGIVPLRDKTPHCAGRNTWNGVAIVLFDNRRK